MVYGTHKCVAYGVRCLVGNGFIRSEMMIWVLLCGTERAKIRYIHPFFSCKTAEKVVE